MKRCKKLNSEIPDCVLSYFSRLPLKDLVKTSVLSKRWLHEWRLRMDPYSLNHLSIAKLKVLDQFQNLKRLELFLEKAFAPSMGYYLILDVLMTSQHLQKLSLTVKNSSHAVGFKSKHARFFRSDLKYVELHGYLCTPSAIEFARHLLRNSNSLEKISFDTHDKFYTGDGT
nr:Cyclin-like F-box; FBD, putative [Medicago truncatula]